MRNLPRFLALAIALAACRGAPAPDRSPQAPPGTPGKLVLQGVPPNARVTLNGRVPTEFDLPPGAHNVVVSAPGSRQFERQVVIAPGGRHTLIVELLALPGGGGRPGPGGEAGGAAHCEEWGVEYNRDNVCFDQRPVPQTPTVVPVPADAPVFPRPVILLIHVSRDGHTLVARVLVPSNDQAFNTQALDVAKNLRWHPAQKNGQPTDAWVQWPFSPLRQ